MFGAEQELGGSVPDGDDNGVDVGEGSERGLEEAGEAEVCNFDAATLVGGFVGAGDEDVGGLKVAVDNPVLVEVVHAVEDLPEKGFDSLHGHELSDAVVMPANHVEEVVLGVVEDEVEGFVCLVEHDVDEVDDVGVFQLAEKFDFADGGG